MLIAQRLIQAYDCSNATVQIHKGVNVNPSDSGVWLCIAMQFILAGMTIPLWSTAAAREGRTYIAASLLQERCASARDLITLASTMDDITFAPEIPFIINYYPTEDELIGDFPIYNLLHSEYRYIPCVTRTDLQDTVLGEDLTSHTLFG